MSEITKSTGLSAYLDDNIFKFSGASKDAEVEFEFPWKASENLIDYIDPGCGCTKAWYEDGKIKGILSIPKAGTFTTGESAVSKIVTVMLDRDQKYLIAGDRLERIVNKEKPFIRLTLTGTVLVKD